MTAEPAEAVEIVRDLLPKASLTGIAFLEILMTRQDGPPPEPAEQFPVNISYQFQAEGEIWSFRVQADAERPDLSASVAMIVQYSIAGSTHALTEPAVASIFAERVALPAAYPFLRSKMFEITVDAGTAPITLNILNPINATGATAPAIDDVDKPKA